MTGSENSAAKEDRFWAGMPNHNQGEPTDAELAAVTADYEKQKEAENRQRVERDRLQVIGAHAID